MDLKIEKLKEREELIMKDRKITSLNDEIKIKDEFIKKKINVNII